MLNRRNKKEPKNKEIRDYRKTHKKIGNIFQLELALKSISRHKFKTMFTDYVIKYTEDLFYIRTQMEIITSNVEGESQKLHNIMLNALSSMSFAIDYSSAIIVYDSIRDDRMITKKYREEQKKRNRKSYIFNAASGKDIVEVENLVIKKRDEFKRLIKNVTFTDDDKTIKKYMSWVISSLKDVLCFFEEFRAQQKIYKDDKIKKVSHSFYRDDWEIDKD